MLSKYIQPGNKLDIQQVDRKDKEKKTYNTKIYEIITEDRIEIMMPMEKGKLILLPTDGMYDLCFYTDFGLYQCFAKIKDRYKQNNAYLLLLELTSNLRKFQRREYYRFSCALEMGSRPLEDEEVKSVEKEIIDLTPGLPLQRSVVVDISGGGLRFVANHVYEPDTLIHCNYHLNIEGRHREYNLVGKVLNVQELLTKAGLFEHRVQYVDINTEEREEIIKFIFDEERKNRRKERWGSES
jgi:c-di-GMP-binding flagellar brake protein YcgR